jgi:retron-type reverse transcriptase
MTQTLQKSTKSATKNVKSSEMWLKLPWQKFQKETYRLQRRIYKASRNGDLAKILSLQKLLFKSYSARMIAIRQITQLNEGKKTPGIDGKTVLTNLKRFNLEKQLHQKATTWKHQALKEVPIPKPDEMDALEN